MNITSNEKQHIIKHEANLNNHALNENKIIELEAKISKLKYISANLDPYSEISDEFKEMLSNFCITEFCDPFTITNKLIILLEDSLVELESLKSKIQ